MDLGLVILEILGGIASIIGLIYSIKMKDALRNRILYIIMLVICIFAGICFNEYKKITDEKIRLEERRMALRQEAKKILDTSTGHISKYYPGENEGLTLTTLVLLEKNKDLFPDTYEIFKEDIVEKMKKSNTSHDVFQDSEDLEISAKASLQILKSLAE